MATDNNHKIHLPGVERQLREAQAQQAWVLNHRLSIAGQCLAQIVGRSDRVKPEHAAARALEAADRLLERALGVKINERARATDETTDG